MENVEVFLGKAIVPVLLSATAVAFGASQQPSAPPKAPTVIVLDVTGDGIALTSVDDGVEFAMDSPRAVQKTAWTKPDSDDSFLRPIPFGFGTLDRSDAGFARPRLWTDRNHDGKTGPGELKTLAESRVEQIDLTFRTYGSIEAAPKDEFGNRRVILGTYKRYKDGTLSPYELVEVALAK